MVCKTINNNLKKSGSTVTTVVITIIIVIGMFSMLFLFMKSQADNESLVLDSKYNDTYNRLVSSQNTLDNNIQDIQDNVADIKEADTTYQVAWNGLKGLGNTIRLPISFTSSAIDTTEAIFISLDSTPSQIKNLFKMAIIIVVLLIILAALAGGNSKL